MHKARPAANVDKVHSGDGLPMAFTGKNVVVGVVDGGFEYGHINFFDQSGSTLRVKRVLNQTTGQEFRSQNAILAAARDYTNETHGTHVAGIAAGSDKNNSYQYYGVATEADIVMVSLNFDADDIDNADVFNGVKYVFDYAEAQKKPAVVNLSLGTHFGPHDGTSYFDRMCDYILGKGKILTGAAGNEAEDELHISKALLSVTDTLKTFMNYYSGDTYGIANIWSDANKKFDFQIVIIKKNNGSTVYSSPKLSSAGQSSDIPINASSTRGTIRIATEVNQTNLRSNALIMTDFYQFNSNHRVGIKIFSSEGTAVNAWADGIYSKFSSFGVNGWTTGNGSYSAGEIGGTGKRIISVGSFITNSSNTSEIGRISSFSSRGPTLDGRVKPEITAPGEWIISSINSFAATSSYVNRVGGKNYYYESYSGTSMASPFVAGAVALWLQVNPNLTPEDIKSLLNRTATKDSFTGTQAADFPNNDWGAGKINVWAGIKELIGTGGDTIITDPANGIFEFENTLSTVGAFSVRFNEDDEDVFLQVFSPDGKVVLTKNYATVAKDEQISYSLPAVKYSVFYVIIKTKKEQRGKYTRIMTK
jgi:subtilisin family serine protease